MGKNLPGFWKKKRVSVWNRDAFTCRYCGLVMFAGHPLLSIDHVIPRKVKMENPHRQENLVTACKPCNYAKADSYDPRTT